MEGLGPSSICQVVSVIYMHFQRTDLQNASSPGFAFFANVSFPRIHVFPCNVYRFFGLLVYLFTVCAWQTVPRQHLQVHAPYRAELLLLWSIHSRPSSLPFSLFPFNFLILLTFEVQGAVLVLKRKFSVPYQDPWQRIVSFTGRNISSKMCLEAATDLHLFSIIYITLLARSIWS